MNAKEYLLQLKKLDTLITNKQEILNGMKLKSICRTPSYGVRSVPTQPNPDSNVNMMISVIALEEELKSDIDFYMEKKQEIIKTIDMLGSSNEIDLLYKKYVQFKSWDQIGYEMAYTNRWVLKLHASALKSLEKVLKSSH